MSSASLSGPYSIIIHGPAGGADPIPRETFKALVRFVTEQWIAATPRATSRASKWAYGMGYIHARDQLSQDWYMETLRSAPDRSFTAFRKRDYDMTTVKVKVPPAISSMEPEVLLRAALSRAEVEGRYGVVAVHQAKSGGKIIRLQLEDSMVKAINRLGDILCVGCDVLRFKTTSDHNEGQPQEGEGEGRGSKRRSSASNHLITPPAHKTANDANMPAFYKVKAKAEAPTNPTISTSWVLVGSFYCDSQHW